MRTMVENGGVAECSCTVYSYTVFMIHRSTWIITLADRVTGVLVCRAVYGRSGGAIKSAFVAHISTLQYFFVVLFDPNLTWFLHHINC